MNVGNQTALHEKEAVNDFIDKGDDMSEVVNSYNTMKRKSKLARTKSRVMDIQTLQSSMKGMALKDKLEVIDLTLDQKLEVINLIATQDEDVRKQLPNISGGCVLCGNTMNFSFSHSPLPDSSHVNPTNVAEDIDVSGAVIADPVDNEGTRAVNEVIGSSGKLILSISIQIL